MIMVSGGEMLLMLVSILAAAFFWGRWYVLLVRPERFGRSRPGRSLLAITPLVAVALVWAVLRTLASADVRRSAFWTAFYVLVGAAWIPVAANAFALFGLSFRDDVAERGNPAAAVALAGALLGLAACFAGGNVGDGPGWWVVVFSAGLATVALLVAWGVYVLLTRAVEAITVERDLGAAVRLAALLVSLGLVLGRGVAGTWVSADDTVAEFGLLAAPGLAILIVACLVERWMGSTRRAGSGAVAVPALVYLGSAALLVVRSGWPL